MSRQRAQVEFFPLPVPGKTLVPRRTETPCFTGAHAASKNGLGNCSRLVPASSQTHRDAVFYSGSSGSHPGTVPSGGTLVPTPKGEDGNCDQKPEQNLSLPGVSATERRPFVFGQRLQYDWRGQLVDLTGLRPGEDGRAPIFVSPKARGGEA
jgi:hypothetical protein